jgi:hypothetical protein
METITRYFVVERDTGKVVTESSYSAQAPATSFAKDLSKQRVRWKQPDPVLLVEERVYGLQSVTPKRAVINGGIFDVTSD